MAKTTAPEARQPPTSTSPTLTSRLHELISACFTGIWVQTHEPHEAAREITDLCRAENWRLGIWNCDSGVQFPIEQIAIPGVTETQDPLAVVRALPQVSQGAGTTVLLFENLHRFLGSVELIQAVARQAITGKHNRAFIVVLAPVTQIPTFNTQLAVAGVDPRTAMAAMRVSSLDLPATPPMLEAVGSAPPSRAVVPIVVPTSGIGGALEGSAGPRSPSGEKSARAEKAGISRDSHVIPAKEEKRAKGLEPSTSSLGS